MKFHDVMFLSGLGFVSAGSFLLAQWLGFVVLGGCVVFVAFLIECTKRKADK